MVSVDANLKMTGFFYCPAPEQLNIVVGQSPLFELPGQNPLLRLASPQPVTRKLGQRTLFFKSLKETPK